MLSDIYQNAQMGIEGIDMVLYKIRSKKLYKIINKEKKEYQKIIKKAKCLAKENKEKITPVSSIAKLSSEIMSNFKLMKNDSDEEIVKMMIEGTYKSLGLLTGKLIIQNNEKTRKLGQEFVNLLEDNIKELKNVY